MKNRPLMLFDAALRPVSGGLDTSSSDALYLHGINLHCRLGRKSGRRICRPLSTQFLGFAWLCKARLRDTLMTLMPSASELSIQGLRSPHEPTLKPKSAAHCILTASSFHIPLYLHIVSAGAVETSCISTASLATLQTTNAAADETPSQGPAPSWQRSGHRGPQTTMFIMFHCSTNSQDVAVVVL